MFDIKVGVQRIPGPVGSQAQGRAHDVRKDDDMSECN